MASLCASVFFFKQKTSYEMRMSDWSSDVCSSDLPAAADQVGRAGQYLQAGDTTGECLGKSRILRPHRVFGPDLCGNRRGHFVAVGIGGNAGAGVDPEKRVHVDQSGRYPRSEEHTSELQSLMRISYAVFCLK